MPLSFIPIIPFHAHLVQTDLQTWSNHTPPIKMRLFQTIAQIIIATSVVNCVPVPPLVDGPSDAGRLNSRGVLKSKPDPNADIPVTELRIKTPEKLPRPSIFKKKKKHTPYPDQYTYAPQPEPEPNIFEPDPGFRPPPGPPGTLPDSVKFVFYPLANPADTPPSSNPPSSKLKNMIPNMMKKKPSESGSSAVGTQQRPAPGIPRHLMPQQPKPNPDTPPSFPPKDQNPPPPALKPSDPASDPPSRRSSVVGNLGHLNAPPDRRSPPKISGNDVISRRLSKLADEELRFRFMSLLARRAIESLDD